MTDQARQGFLYGLVAYGWWGLVPLYFRWLRDDVSATAMLAHRVLWSAAFLALVLTGSRRWSAVGRCLRDCRRLLPLAASALLIGANWLAYIFSVHQDKIAHASLGYYITPLLSVCLGLAVFRERMRALQWVAVTLAAGGVAWLTWALGELPWIALTVACSFSAYGLIRKRVPVDGLVGLTVETILLLPLALAYLGVIQVQGADGWTPVDGELAARLALSGVVTAVPLLCFGQAARRLPLSSLGFLQYVSPTVQLLLAVFLFGERLAEGSLLGFGLIWAALAIFSVDSYIWFRQREAVEEVVDRSPPATTERCIAAES